MIEPEPEAPEKVLLKRFLLAVGTVGGWVLGVMVLIDVLGLRNVRHITFGHLILGAFTIGWGFAANGLWYRLLPQDRKPQYVTTKWRQVRKW
ncbi:hypothetical protein [Catellatospora sp. TT07R-123]|uniref:hypothetical protein n=1 Tax=Catellatospora sp. TT07R-123 TaxID=2733863 RepID=UPI001BB30D17|nr:hypothetical protein [Catellatospora sp. TT07R-123]